MRRLKSITMAAVLASFLAGCAAHNPKMWEPARAPKATPVTTKLNALPPSGQRAAVAVYSFTDQTGQFKSTDGAQTLSRAVTQGATSILVKTLHEAGNRKWFTVVERERLENLLRERAVIREMRASYLGETKINPQALPPLLFAGVLLEGGIIGYDSNTKTGGSGARLLGIGGRTQYREDTVTVYLRAVSVKTGEVLASVSSRKSIASVAVGADAFRFVAFRELLELEAGVTYNEPDELALRQAIEASVYSLIMEGAMQDLWCFNGSNEQVSQLLTDYIADRDSIPTSLVELPSSPNGTSVAGRCGTQKVAQQSIEQARQNTSTNARPKPAARPVNPAYRPAQQQPSPRKPARPQPALQQMAAPDVSVSATRSTVIAQRSDHATVSAGVPVGEARASRPADGTPFAQNAAVHSVMNPDQHDIASASFAQWSSDGFGQCAVGRLSAISASDLAVELGRRILGSGTEWAGAIAISNRFARFGADNRDTSAATRVALNRSPKTKKSRKSNSVNLSGRSVRDIAIASGEEGNGTIDRQPFGFAAIAFGGWLNSIFGEEQDTIRIELRRS